MSQGQWPWEEQAWAGTQQEDTWIGEDGRKVTCRTKWHCLACCPDPIIFYTHCPMEPCILHKPMEVWASRKPDHRCSAIGKRVNECVTLAVCPRGRVTAPDASQHASWVQPVCPSPCVPPGSGRAASGAVVPGTGAAERGGRRHPCPGPRSSAQLPHLPAAVGAVMRWSSRRTAR